MKYKTPFSRWVQAITLDSIVIGGLAYAIYYNVTLLQNVYVFLLWWLYLIALLTMIIMLGNQGNEKFWKPELMAKLVHSDAFKYYHIITDLVVVSLLVVMGNPVLASVKMLVLVVGLSVTETAREILAKSTQS